MGKAIGALLELFRDRVPDAESNAHVRELVDIPHRWSAGHALFDEIRDRLLAAMTAKDKALETQYAFEESCCQAMYNATEPNNPFDPSSAFFVVPQALNLAQTIDIALETILTALTIHEA